MICVLLFAHPDSLQEIRGSYYDSQPLGAQEPHKTLLFAFWLCWQMHWRKSRSAVKCVRWAQVTLSLVDTGSRRGIAHLQHLRLTPFCILMMCADAQSFLTAPLPHYQGWWALATLGVHLRSYLHVGPLQAPCMMPRESVSEVPILLDWLDCIEVQTAVRREELSLWEPLCKSSQNNAIISLLGSKGSKVLSVWVGFY